MVFKILAPVLQGQGVMLAQVFFMADFESGGVHGTHDVAGSGEFTVGEDVPVDEGGVVVGGLFIIGSGDGVIEHAPFGTQFVVGELEVRRVVGSPDVFG